MLLNQSNLYRHYLRPYRIQILIVMCLLLFLHTGKKVGKDILYLIFLFGTVIFIRIWAGGTGLETFADYAIPVMATLCAISIDRNSFVKRFIKVAIFLCLWSLIGTAISYIAPQLLRTLGTEFTTGSGVSTWTSATDYTTRYYKGYGLLLYSWIDRPTYQRNIGIFTEPGIFQMLINTVIFMLLFMRKWITEFSEKQINKYLAILLFSLITCQSTTGFICGGAILLGALWENQEINSSIKKKIAVLIGAAIVGFAIDYFVRGQESILNTIVLNKLVDVDGAFSLAASSSGEARLGTIAICLQSMITHPLGMGTVRTGAIILNASDANVAGALLAFGAAMGIIPFAVTMCWIFKPVFKCEMSTIAKWLYVFLYLNITLAQSSIFYPALIVIPLVIGNITMNNNIDCELANGN